MRTRPAALLLVLGLLAVLVGVWLMLDNPSIDTATGSRGCAAPYDTVLRSADNFPGGEPPADGRQIAKRCRDAGRARFVVAASIVVIGGITVASPGGAALRRRTRARRAEAERTRRTSVA